MLEDRGYKIQDNIFAKPDEKKGILFMFPEDEKLNTEMANQIIVQSVDYNHLIVVYHKSITPKAKKMLSYLPKRVEIFVYNEFVPYRKVKHVLVPEHKKASEGELKQIRHLIDNLPLIKMDDPIVKYYGFIKKDVIKINRKNGPITFRRVV